MKIQVKFSRTNSTKTIEIETGSSVEDLLIKLNLRPDTLIVMSKDQPIPIDDELNEGQELTILQVSSGG